MPAIGTSKAQTLRQAKKAHKTHGARPQTSERDKKRLERELVLADRAEQARDKERRRQQALKRKAAKEESAKESRKRTGIGLATQMVGYSHSQKTMKAGMEQFVRFGRPREEHNPQPQETYAEDEFEVDTDTWADDNTAFEDASLDNNKTSPIRQSPPQLGRLMDSFGDDIDDESLAKAADYIGARVSAETSKVDDVSFPKSTVPAQAASKCHNGEQAETRHSPPNRLLTARQSLPRPSRCTPPRKLHNPSVLELSPGLDFWADFIVSNTQVANEITPPRRITSKPLFGSIIDTTTNFSNIREGDVSRATKSESCLSRHVDGFQQKFKRPDILASASRKPAFAKAPETAFTANQSQKTRSPSLQAPCRLVPAHEESGAEMGSSSYGAFGLSTQVVHDLIDDELDLSDGSQTSHSPRYNAMAGQTLDFTASDSFGSDTDFG